MKYIDRELMVGAPPPTVANIEDHMVQKANIGGPTFEKLIIGDQKTI